MAREREFLLRRTSWESTRDGFVQVSVTFLDAERQALAEVTKTIGPFDDVLETFAQAEHQLLTMQNVRRYRAVPLEML